MPRKEILDQIQKYVHPFRVTNGKGFQLKDFKPDDTRGLKMEKGEAADLLHRGTQWLAEEQEMLYAQDRWSLLLVFQAMDAAGKDGNDQARHVGRESARLPGFLFQAAFTRGTRPRLHVAVFQTFARARADRDI